jgi:hypothetical protein
MRALLIAVSFTFLLLLGCSTAPVPTPQGPTAVIRDSFKPLERNGRKIAIFYAARLDGTKIPDSLSSTRRRNHGQGFNLAAQVEEREVPAREVVVLLEAKTHFAAPVLAFTGPSYSATRTIRVTLSPNVRYQVRGVLGSERSDVWLEEEATGKIVGETITAQ